MYKDVNLGSLIQSEFINILVNFLKSFFELYKISLTNKNTIFFCSGINYKILKLFSSNVRILSQSDESFDFSPLDSLKIGFKIGTDTKKH